MYTPVLGLPRQETKGVESLKRQAKLSMIGKGD